MSSLHSPIEAIADLRIEPLPSGSKVAITYAVKMGGTTVLLGKTGQIYCDRIKTRAAYGFGVWPFTEQLLKALCKLGAISQAAFREHMAKAIAADKRRSEDFAKQRIEGYCADLGVQLSPAQRRIIAKKGTQR